MCGTSPPPPGSSASAVSSCDTGVPSRQQGMAPATAGAWPALQAPGARQHACCSGSRIPSLSLFVSAIQPHVDIEKGVPTAEQSTKPNPEAPSSRPSDWQTQAVSLGPHSTVRCFESQLLIPGCSVLHTSPPLGPEADVSQPQMRWLGSRKRAGLIRGAHAPSLGPGARGAGWAQSREVLSRPSAPEGSQGAGKDRMARPAGL